MRFSPESGLEIRRNERLAYHTSLRIGGRVDYFIRVYSKKGLRQVLMLVTNHRFKYLVIGAGTNLLFSDRGFRGVVIKLCGSFSVIQPRGDRFVCGAGVYLKTLVRKACDARRSGVEFLVGIPGTVGGAVKGNAGAWGHAIGEITESVTVMRKNGRELILRPKDIGFKYRSSLISDRDAIMSVALRLRSGCKKMISKTMKEYMVQRDRRQPRGFSAGSFFKNEPGNPAGKLIEECGLKGARIGHAMVSLKHGNFIMNCGDATAADVLALVAKIRSAVYQKRRIRLQPEVRIVR